MSLYSYTYSNRSLAPFFQSYTYFYFYLFIATHLETWFHGFSRMLQNSHEMLWLRNHNEIPNRAQAMAADMGEISSKISSQVYQFWTEPRVRNSRQFLCVRVWI